MITDYTQSTAANFSENSLPELSISTVDPQQVSDTIPCTNSFAALSDSTDNMNNMLAPVCTGALAIKFCQHYSAKSSSLSSLYHSPSVKNVHCVAYFHHSTKDCFNISSQPLTAAAINNTAKNRFQTLSKFFHRS